MIAFNLIVDYEEEYADYEGIADRIVFFSAPQPIFNVIGEKRDAPKIENSSRKSKKPKIRKSFPETWIFDSIDSQR